MTSFSRKMTANKYNQFSVYVNELYLGENENTFYANDCRKQILFVSRCRSMLIPIQMSFLKISFAQTKFIWVLVWVLVKVTK